MDNILTYLVINSLWIFGFSSLFDFGMIFDKVDVWLSVNFKWSWLQKPIYSCPTCMSSVHGGIGFVFTGMDLIYLPVYLVALVGLNALVTKFVFK